MLPTITAHCCDAAAADALWRMLLHAPAEDFQPVALVVAGHPHGVILRDEEGNQTTTPAAG
jgi:hypothetical protein